MNTLKLACAQYPIGRFATFADWQENAAIWVARAVVDGGAQMLLFPEYGGMELTSLLPPHLQRDLTAQIAALQQFHEAFVATYRDLARQHGVYISAPSLPVTVGAQFHNRAYVFSPDGGAGWQEKRQMTRFERESWTVASGPGLKVFEAPFGRFAISICYDIEFPLIARALSDAGADLILVPSCTDTLAGANRVQVGARARALENQIYVATSPTVGNAEWSPAVDVNTGWASVLATPDRGFPDDGVIARGELSQPGWIYAELDFDLLRKAREDTQVFTRRDWTSQDRPTLEVATERL